MSGKSNVALTQDDHIITSDGARLIRLFPESKSEEKQDSCNISTE